MEDLNGTPPQRFNYWECTAGPAATLLDQYIAKPADNPFTEHKSAGQDMALMIHDMGFIAWHQHFIAKLENWLIMNG